MLNLGRLNRRTQQRLAVIEMGYDICFYKLKDGSMVWDEQDVPESFTVRYEGRQEWQFAMLNVPHDSRATCECDFSYDGKHIYGCSAPDAWRPLDFAAFRKILKTRGLWHKPFRCMTRWMERHPEVYLSFSS